MENGIDLNEIPGEKAAIGERIQSNFPKKNRSSSRRNNDFVDVEPIRNVQQFIDRFQKPRVHVPEIRKPPFNSPFQSDNSKGFFHKLLTGFINLLVFATVVAVCVGALYVGAIAVELLFIFIGHVLVFLWQCVKVLFTIWIIILLFSLVD